MALTVPNKDGSIMGSTRNLNLESYQNPYASQLQKTPFSRVNFTAALPKPTPGQGGIPQDAIFRSATPSTGGTKAPDMSAYAPGKAQPVQSQSTGTPYGRYAPGTTAADIAKQPYTDHMLPNPSYAGSARPQRFDSVLAADAPWWAGEFGNLPHNPADNRPAYGPTGNATGANAGNFQPSAPAPQNPFANMAPGVYYGGQQIPGNQQQALATAMAQRDAMSVLVNNNNLQYQMANAFGQDLGRPQFDYGSAMQQAQNMVANGFYNPFTQYYNQATNPTSQPFPPIGGLGVQPQRPTNAIQDLFTQNNIQTPPGFMDQLIRLLGGSAPQPVLPPMSGPPTLPSPQPAGPNPGLRYVPAEYRDGKLWSDAHYVNDNPPIPEYAPPGMYGGRAQPTFLPPSVFPEGHGPMFPGTPPSRPGTAKPIQPPSQGTPPAPRRSLQEIGRDFYDPNPGGIKFMVVQDWYNPQTGEEYGGTGIAPREGTGWVPGKSPQKRLAELRGDLERAERGAVNPPARWDQDIRGVRVFDGDAESFAQTAELIRRQIAELENAGPASTAQPPSVFPEGDRMPRLPAFGPAPAQPTFLPPSVFPEGHGPMFPGAPPFRPGTAQPIQPPSQGTPYGGRTDDSAQYPATDPIDEYYSLYDELTYGGGRFPDRVLFVDRGTNAGDINSPQTDEEWYDRYRAGFTRESAEKPLSFQQFVRMRNDIAAARSRLGDLEKSVKQSRSRAIPPLLESDWWRFRTEQDLIKGGYTPRQAAYSVQENAGFRSAMLKKFGFDSLPAEWRAFIDSKQAGGTAKAQPGAAAKAQPMQPPPRTTQTPEDIAAIEKGRQYKQSQLAAFKSQFEANVRARKSPMAGMSRELIQTAQYGIQDGDPEWGKYRDVVYRGAY